MNEDAEDNKRRGLYRFVPFIHAAASQTEGGCGVWLKDQNGEIPVRRCKVFVVGRGLHYAALEVGLEASAFSFLIREVRQEDQSENIVTIHNKTDQKTIMRGVIAATLTDFSAADAMISNLEDALWSLKNR